MDQSHHSYQPPKHVDAVLLDFLEQNEDQWICASVKRLRSSVSESCDEGILAFQSILRAAKHVFDIEQTGEQTLTHQSKEAWILGIESTKDRGQRGCN